MTSSHDFSFLFLVWVNICVQQRVCVTVSPPHEYHSTTSSDEHLLTIYISKSFEMYQTYFDGHNECNIKKITQKKMA